MNPAGMGVGWNLEFFLSILLFTQHFWNFKVDPKSLFEVLGIEFSENR